RLAALGELAAAARLAGGARGPGELAIVAWRELGQPCQEGRHGPDLVVPLLSRPRRHGRVLEPVLDDPEDLLRVVVGEGLGEGWRRREHRADDRVHRLARPAVARRAAAFEMAGAELDQLKVVERRRILDER